MSVAKEMFYMLLLFFAILFAFIFLAYIIKADKD